MKKAVILFFALVVFLVSAVFAQETLRDRIKERLKVRAEEKTGQKVNVFSFDVYDYSEYEKAALGQGWKKITIDINGTKRSLFWKGPSGLWKNGAIIAIHGGGGSYTNFTGDFRINKPSKDFSDLAIANGFAVFVPDSTKDIVTDAAGRSAGKRFDCIELSGKQTNIDLIFIQKIIVSVIPEARPHGSADDVFMTGISNGGFMSILAATHFDDKITAFAPVSAGDPYGTHMDCRPELTSRKTAPGSFIDNETGKSTIEDNACAASAYPHEQPWRTANPGKKPAFKMFYDTADGALDVSCKKKVEQLLKEHGYPDDISFVVDDGNEKNILKHFWLKEYNQPIVDFFIRSRSK